MKNTLRKSMMLLMGCLLSSLMYGQSATPIANLDFEITSSTTAVPANYVYSSSNTPSIKTQNSITCIIISNGGGSTAPTFNGTSAPTGGKRWMAFCPDVDCDVLIGIMSSKKTFYIQNKDGEFFSYTNTANQVEEQTVKGLKAGEWYALCGGSSQVYITKMKFTATGGGTPSTPVVNVTGIAFSKSQTEITLNAGDTKQLNPSISPSDATNKAVTWSTADSKVATVSDGLVTGVAAGKTTITVTTVDGGFTADCVVNVNGSSTPTPPTPPTPTPSTTLKLHEPEVYEATKQEGGYNMPLVNISGRDYEIYYLSQQDGNHIAAGGSPRTNKNDPSQYYDVANSGDNSTYNVDGGWITINTTTSWSGSKDVSKDEFGNPTAQSTHYVYLTETDSVVMHIKGYDQFTFIGNDKSEVQLDSKTGVDKKAAEHLKILVDGTEIQHTASKTDYSMFRIDITSSEHVIKVTGTGSGQNRFRAFSLRVSDNPRVKLVSGDDKTQQVNQTRDMQPITYYIKYHKSHTFEWVSAEATGITLTQGTNDTLYLSGQANCPAGTYVYKLSAQDANGNTVDEVTGSFSVKTEVRTTFSADTTVYIDYPLSGLDFEYDAINSGDITVSWDQTPAGISSQAKDGIFSLTGTPTEAGTYTYTVTAQGGNSVTGQLTVYVPDPVIQPSADQEASRKATQALAPIEWTILFADNKTTTVTGLPSGVNFNFSGDKLTLTGTPAAETSYPKTYTYTITATPKYAGKQTVTATGVLRIIDPNAKVILYVYKNDYKDGIYSALQNDYEVIPREQQTSAPAADSYSGYDLVAISESVDANNEEVLAIVKSVKQPVLNLKNFTYTTSRLGWGFPDNGSVTATKLIVQQPSHPVFNGFAVQEGSELDILSKNDGKALMPAEITLNGSVCLALSPKRGDNYTDDGALQTALHEVPTAIRGGKYMMLGLDQKASANLNATGKKLLSNIVSYLLAPAQTFASPELRISSFSIDGNDAAINESDLTIKLQLAAGTDLTALTPSIQLVGVGTFSTPADGETTDFSNNIVGVPIVVSDYINRKVYTAYITTPTGLDGRTIEGVYYDGNTLHNPLNVMLNIYTVAGQLIAITNQDFTFTQRGIYLIQAADASIRIVK